MVLPYQSPNSCNSVWTLPTRLQKIVIKDMTGRKTDFKTKKKMNAFCITWMDNSQIYFQFKFLKGVTFFNLV